MKSKIIIKTWVWMILLAFFNQTVSAFTQRDKTEVLQSFVKKGILYNNNISVDSVIRWSKQVLPTMKQDKKAQESYFLLQLQLVNAYIFSGHTSLAIDCAQLMYEKAKEMGYKFGLATASQAIGDAYSISNQTDKALDSYQDALREIVLISPHHPYRKQLLLKESITLQCMGRQQEAEEIRLEIKNILKKQPDPAIHFFLTLEDIYNDIYSKRTSHNHLKEAAMHLQSLDSIYNLYPEKHYNFHLRHATAAYFTAMGSRDKKYLTKAQYIYDELKEEYANRKQSTYYRWVSMEIINLHKIQNRHKEACLLYQELCPTGDTLISEAYTRQIDILRTKYKTDQLKTENQKAHNKIITILFVGSIFLLVLFCFITFRLRRQRNIISRSTNDLAHLRANAERAMATKSIFLSNMSHEIRTPLNALSGFSSLLTEDGLDEETRHQCNEVIQQNSELLLKLINDVIDMSNLEFGKMQFSIAQHDVVATCQNVIDTVNKVKQTQAEALFKTDLESMVIDTDDARLQQILINLLINSTKFTPKGSITLELKKESEEWLLFTVTDTGCGIPKDKQGNIFQRFEKLNENAQGSGLGLSICQLIIEHLGGKIWIDPDHKGGSRFVFNHPIKKQNPKDGKENKA